MQVDIGLLGESRRNRRRGHGALASGVFPHDRFRARLAYARRSLTPLVFSTRACG